MVTSTHDDIQSDSCCRSSELGTQQHIERRMPQHAEASWSVQSAYALCDISQTTYCTLLHPLSFVSRQGTTFFACNCHQPAVAHCYLKTCHHTCNPQSCMQCQPSADQEKQTLLNRYDPLPTSQPSAGCSFACREARANLTWQDLTVADFSIQG